MNVLMRTGPGNASSVISSKAKKSSDYSNGRESRYQVYLVKLNGKQWIGIPEMGISSELSYLDDTFWNSEQIGHQLNSIIDGLTIANGLKLIGKL